MKKGKAAIGMPDNEIGNETVSVLGVNIARVTADGAADAVFAAVCAPGADREPYLVVTPNPTMLMNAQKLPELREALNGASLATADGVGVVSAARRAGTPLPERVTGIDTGCAVLGRCAGAGKKVCLLGAKPGVAEQAAANLTAALPGLCVCGVRDGYFGDGESGEVTAWVRSLRPDLLIVCIGSPRQELWAYANRAELRGVGAVMTLGGALDVWAGRVKRAPAFVRRLRLEWAWRMLREPARLRALPAILRFRWRTRRRGSRKNAER